MLTMSLTVICMQWMNWGIFDIQYARIVFLASWQLIYSTVVLSEIHILSKIKLEWIDYIFISSNFQLYYRKEAK